LEYGQSTLELSCNVIKKGDNIALIDDLLATGGSALAANELISKSGGVIKIFLFVIELLELKGREKLPLKTDIYSLVSD
jgi:adenine phosphoribosyltransferase